MNKIILLVFLMVLTAPVMAQGLDNLSGNNKGPVEISADKTLEWLQKKKQYVANGNVEIKQGDVSIKADKIIADYRDDNKGGNVEIYQMTATTNVTIKNADSTVTGDKAVYNIDSGAMTITGNNLRLVSQNQIITANERLEYNTLNGEAKAIGSAKIQRADDIISANDITAQFGKDNTGKQTLKTAQAVGNAIITQAGDSLSANKITADFVQDSTGKQTLNTARANGNVRITTPDEIITGNNGIYNARNNTAEITGNVKVKRGPNTLEGARAQVNLTTNVSKMFGAPQSGKRVKAVFFPGSQKAGN